MNESNKMSAHLYEQVLNIAEQYDSFYIYEEQRIKSQLRSLQVHFPGIEFLYSVKCNPNRDVLNVIFKHGFGADAASLGEVKLAGALGLPRDQIYYSAPGKSLRDIREALPLTNLVADSLAEIGRISVTAGSAEAEDCMKEDGKIWEKAEACPAAVGLLKIGLRINPDFTFDSDIGAASKFGIDEQDVLKFLSSGKVPANIRIAGIHVHVKSQELDHAKLEKYYRNVIRMAENVEAVLGYQLDYVNLGSGIGIAYSDEESEIDIAELGRETVGVLSGYRKTHPNTKIVIETGRYVVCQSGFYVTHVADRKVSHGKTYIILQNTLNGFIRPSLARLVEKYAAEAAKPSDRLPEKELQCRENPVRLAETEPQYREKPIRLPATEPLFTETDAFSIIAPYPERESEIVTIVGNLCTAADVVAENISLPHLVAGDIVMINNAGAYAAVLSPMQFSSQEAPGEFLVGEN